MADLPVARPKWYSCVERRGSDKGWTPETSDITSHNTNREVREAWNGNFLPTDPEQAAVCVDRLRIITPIQVGGGSFPEGGILPAQVNGVPWIPGSAIRGALLRWVERSLSTMAVEEVRFWQGLIGESGWQPRKIRFESIRLHDLKPYPLNAQQSWQVFNEANKALGIQWQSSSNPQRPFKLFLRTKDVLKAEEVAWLQTRITEMLLNQGIGRGTAAGFGRLVQGFPTFDWELRLWGMKPCVQNHDNKKQQTGEYRWSPQVLRANLRGHFTRLALAVLTKDHALSLTSKVFGGFGSPSLLKLPNWLDKTDRNHQVPQGYANIPAAIAHQTWIIQARCNPEFIPLINHLLELASRIGGLGPGWRRPPHKLSFGGFRGSEFTIARYPADQDLSQMELTDLLNQLYGLIRQLAQAHHLPLQQVRRVSGGFLSIWRGDEEQWNDVVHGVCSSKKTNRPAWCGDSQRRPSGYSVRQYSDHCLITVFDPAVEGTLRQLGFQQIYSLA